ncbi:MAG TPA: hypothetical protein VK698_35690 [Kofleriaceae bacterium]|nr:hypothetical protein [Kofleriaceae bacterium]
MWRSMVVVVVAWTAACGGDGAGSVDGGNGRPDAGPSAGTCEPAATGAAASGVVRIGARRGRRGEGGWVEAVMVADQAWRFSGLAPQLQQETAREGDCVLYEYEPSFCDQPCDGFCVEDTCRAYPRYLSAGTLHVTGAGEPLDLEPDALTYWGAEYRREIDPPPAGAAIQLCAAGGDTAGFTADLVAVEPLDIDIPDDLIVLADGDDLALDWTPSSDPDARVRLTLNTDNEHHGLPFAAIIECDTADEGHLVVPRALIEAFPPVAAPPPGPVACSGTDCPVSRLTRYRAAQVTASELSPELSVEVVAEQAIELYIGH